MQYHGYDTDVSSSSAQLLRIHTDDRQIKVIWLASHKNVSKCQSAKYDVYDHKNHAENVIQ